MGTERGAGRPRPYVCVVCRQRRSYYGRLVWEIELEPGKPAPSCSNHKLPQPLIPA